MNSLHLTIGVIIGVLLLWLSQYSNIKETQSFKVGQCVQLKGNDLRGIIMEIISGDYFIWWEDQKRYDPWRDYAYARGKQYWYHSDQLIRSFSADLKIPIYYRFNKTTPPIYRIIGEYMCINSTCLQCLRIYAIWQSRLLLTESGTDLWDRPYDELINFGYIHHQTINLTDPNSCVYVGICKLARKNPVPDYCFR